MKIKHWQGYGTVEATKVLQTYIDRDEYISRYINHITNGQRWEWPRYLDSNLVELTIRVSGNHEWGLVREDTYDLYNWLVSRFYKKGNDYRDILGWSYEYEYGADEEQCIYKFVIEEV